MHVLDENIVISQGSYKLVKENSQGSYNKFHVVKSNESGYYDKIMTGSLLQCALYIENLYEKLKVIDLNKIYSDKTIVALENHVESQLKASGINAEMHRLDGEKLIDTILEVVGE